MTRDDIDCIYVTRCELDRGLFAGRAFSEGEFVFRFTGPAIGFADALAKGEAESNPLQIGPNLYIDTEAPGVFTNHSCEPNVGIRDACEVYALHEIQRGEELRFDYSTTMSERHWTMRCLCGTPSCRGIIGDFHDLPEDLQLRYLAMGIVQPFIVEEWYARRTQ